MKNQASHNCYQCHSPLILVKKVVEQPSGSRFPQTTTIYKCSNEACQEEKDREAVKRKELREEKERQVKERLEKTAAKRKALLDEKAEKA